jgi:3',5'-cyclic-AMP phosphodiesterase
MTFSRVPWAAGPRACLLAAALATACVRPAEERAQRDREVGRATSQGLGVEVVRGLGAVRQLNGQQLTVWGSAPNFELVLSVEEPRVIRLEVQNCLAAALLSPISDGVSVAPLPSTLPTRKNFELTLPAGTSRLRLGAPDSATRGPFVFALLSDVQEAIDDVQDVFQRINAETDVRFLLGAGDLTEDGGISELVRYQRELETLTVPYFTTLGNHELGASPPAYQDYFGRGNFQFYERGVAFTLLDSASATLDPLVYDWLGPWLDGARDDVHVVAMHIPPLDPIGVRNGAFASRGEAAALLARFAERGVDLTLYGHIHSYYAFDNAGIPAFISGGGGAIPERFDDIGRHFMRFEIDPDRGIVDRRVVRVD